MYLAAVIRGIFSDRRWCRLGFAKTTFIKYIAWQLTTNNDAYLFKTELRAYNEIFNVIKTRLFINEDIQYVKMYRTKSYFTKFQIQTKPRA